MLGAISGAMDAVSGVLGGAAGGAAAENAPVLYVRGENLGEQQQSLAGAQAPGDRRPIDAGAAIEFIHMGRVFPDNSKNFNHSDAKKDDAVEDFPNGAKLRGFQYRAALHREALLLACNMTGCEAVMDALEKSKGGLADMVGMAADLLGAGGGSSAAPKAADVTAFGMAVKTAVAKVNTPVATYHDVHQCGMDLHQARANYRAFLNKLMTPPANDKGGGLLGKLPVVGAAIPAQVADVLNFVTGLAFKPMDVYLHFYVRLAKELEPSVEKAVLDYSVAALKGPLTPAFYLWYPAPELVPTPEAPTKPTGIPFLDKARQEFDGIRKDGEGYRQKVTDFLAAGKEQDPPGMRYLNQAFQGKDLAGLVLAGFKGGLGVNRLPGFVESVIQEIVEINDDFLREIYRKLMERPAVEPINELAMYEAARLRLLQRLVDIVMAKVSVLKQAKEFEVNGYAPGGALLEKGMEELNAEVLRRLNVALELSMGELVDKLEGIRQQCVKSNAVAMEAYLGLFPWLLALNFRNTFLPVWQLIMDNTFGKISGPIGDAVRSARDAMNAAKSMVDDARTVAMRLQKIKDRATREGMQMGSSGQNLTGYQQDWASELPPDQQQPKPQVVSFFPFGERVSAASADKITKTEYDTVKGSHQWEGAAATPGA